MRRVNVIEQFEFGRFRMRAFGEVHADDREFNDGVVENAKSWDQFITIVLSHSVSNLNESQELGARLREGAVRLICDGEVVPFIQKDTYYDPFGGAAGIDGVVPVVNLRVLRLKTRSICILRMDDTAVGPNGLPVCAPPNGDPLEGCTPGDLSLIEFQVMPFQVIGTNPVPGGTLSDLDQDLLLYFSADVQSATLGSVSVSSDAGAVPIIASLLDGDSKMVVINPDDPLARDTRYTITTAGGEDGLQETLGPFLPEDYALMFTTRP